MLNRGSKKSEQLYMKLAGDSRAMYRYTDSVHCTEAGRR